MDGMAWGGTGWGRRILYMAFWQIIYCLRDLSLGMGYYGAFWIAHIGLRAISAIDGW